MLESLFNKVAGLKACNFIKKDTNTGVVLLILRNFEKPLRAAASKEHVIL